MNEEIWSDHFAINGYSFSNLGRIKNKNTGRILCQHKNRSGYMQIMINKKTYRAHRLIAEVFIPNPENKPTVNHKDKDRSNNNVSNLEWATNLEQASHRNLNSTHIINNKKGVWKCDAVTQTKIEFYSTLREASDSVSGHPTSGCKNISCCALGKSKIAYGFHWKYDEFENLPGEIWVNIRDTYFISNKGRLCNDTRLLRPKIHHTGYVYFGAFSKAIHIIVAEAFIPNPNNKPEVNHIDVNRANNCVENLEWVTQSENVKHAVKFRSNVRKVINYREDGTILEIYESAMEVERKMGIIASSVNKCCKGQILSCGNGLLFKYLSETDDLEQKIIDKTTIPKKEYKDNPKPASIFKIEVLNKSNQRIDLLNTKVEIVKKYNVNVKTITAHCEGIAKYPSGDYIFRYSDVLKDK